MSNYLKYTIKNIEPLRIADDNTSLRGQAITLRYIPGTSIRGYIINTLAKDADFEDIKVDLFKEQVCFMNAYLSDGNKALIPSPKGFYEDKTGNGAIESVLIDGSVKEGTKRAALGRYCCFDQDTVHYYSVDTNSDMKITIQNDRKKIKQDVFRNEFMAAGHNFTGYIRVDDEKLRDRIKKAFQDTLLLGNARSQGFGKCKLIELKEIDTLPYLEMVNDNDMEGECYLYLLSNTVMRDENGNFAGLDLPTLEKKLEVENLEISLCSTSIVEVKGYNRNWNSKVQSVNMYEQGSIFKLRFSGKITKENAFKLMDTGIGIRKNEGYGRILFLKGVEQLKHKHACVIENSVNFEPEQNKEDMQVLKLVAQNYYLQLLEHCQQECLVTGKHIIKGAKAARVRALIAENRYDTVNAMRVIEKYFEHAAEKEAKQNIQKKRDSISGIQKTVMNILKTPFEDTIGMEHRSQVMGVEIGSFMTEQEYLKLKLNYILRCIRIENRKEGR